MPHKGGWANGPAPSVLPMTLSPYAKPGFYEDALARGRHRDIVGGRWEETGDTVIPLLFDLGLRRSDRFLDIGAGSLRLGCRIIPELLPGHYWATDASGALMRRGWEVELTPDQQARLPQDQLIEDAEFRFPGVPPDIDFALCFAVFTHLPLSSLRQGLAGVRAKFPGLRRLIFTVFIAPDPAFAAPYRQRDGVVTHPNRTPWHHLAQDVQDMAAACGFALTLRSDRLPRGQVLCVADPTRP